MAITVENKVKIRSLLPTRYVKPIMKILEREGADDDLKSMKPGMVKYIVTNEARHSPLWPYVLLYVESLAEGDKYEASVIKKRTRSKLT